MGTEQARELEDRIAEAQCGVCPARRVAETHVMCVDGQASAWLLDGAWFVAGVCVRSPRPRASVR